MEIAQSVPRDMAVEADLLAAYPMLVRRLTVVLRDDHEAQDMAQAAYARSLERRSSFRGGDARAWLFTIGLRLALNEIRRRRRLAALPDEGGPEWAMTSEPDLWAALGELDPPQRAAMVLSVLDGYSHAEIAGMLGVRPGTVSSWISRSRDRLRAALEEPGNG